MASSSSTAAKTGIFYRKYSAAAYSAISLIDVYFTPFMLDPARKQKSFVAPCSQSRN